MRFRLNVWFAVGLLMILLSLVASTGCGRVTPHFIYLLTYDGRVIGEFVSKYPPSLVASGDRAPDSATLERIYFYDLNGEWHEWSGPYLATHVRYEIAPETQYLVTKGWRPEAGKEPDTSRR